MRKVILYLPLIISSIYCSCTNEHGALILSATCENIDSKYSTSIKPIIISTCVSSRCHDGGGVAPTNYTTYDGLMVSVNLGTFKNRVLEIKDMPVKLSLSELELQKITCWLNDGAKNN